MEYAQMRFLSLLQRDADTVKAELREAPGALL